MADFTLSKSLFSGKYRNASSTHGSIAYALFVLFCFWAGAQLLNLLVHAPGVYERLMQVRETGRPRVEIGLGVGTIFGLIPFLVGCLILQWWRYGCTGDIAASKFYIVRCGLKRLIWPDIPV